LECGDVLAVLSREEWMKTFQVELDVENPDANWAEGPPLDFFPNLGKRTSMDRGSLLKKALLSYQFSRQKLYGDMSWLKGPEISEAALAGYLPSLCYYPLSKPSGLTVQLGNERTTLPLVGVGKRLESWARILTPPSVTEAGFDPGTWTVPVMSPLQIEILADQPAPFGLRRCS